MTQQQHLITPPPELVAAWCREADDNEPMFPQVAAKAAQWGADQELEACCEWVSQWTPRWPDGTRPEDELRAARRPKPPSLKEQALTALDDASDRLNAAHENIIRRALEQLND